VSAASAQSSVSLSGLLDYSVGNGEITTQTGSSAATTVKANNTGAQNVFSTGQVSISGTEDLGGGLKASFVINTGIAGASSFADRDTFVSLAGGFGNLRVGKFAPAAATGFHALSGSPSTAVGSIYGMTSSGTTAAARFGVTTTNFERNANNVQYTSPSFSGLTLNANYGTNTSDSSLLLGKADTTQTGLSATFVNGPLIVAAGINSKGLDAEAVSAVASDIESTPMVLGVVAKAATQIKSDLNWVGASYKMGAATLYASHVMREDKNTVAATTLNDVNVTTLGVAVPMGAYTFNASTYTGKNDVTSSATDNTKLSGYQISARYALSKRTSAYALIGENQIKRDSGNTGGAAFKETVTAFGLIHSF
jgi:predicted porin